MTTDDQSDQEDAVTTGVLDAERRARDEVARRRRLLLGSATIGLLLVAALLTVITVLQQQANREAELVADRAEARASFAAAVVGQAEDYEPPATIVGRDAPSLRDVMEQFLTATDESDEALRRRVDLLAERLDQQAATVADLRARDVPEPPELVTPARAVTVLRELETLRAEATALAEEVPAASADAVRWADAVVGVNAAVAAHVAQVESEDPTSDPAALVELWEAERTPLLRLAAAARGAGDVEGLHAWADAHESYARSLLAWIDDAVQLLEAGELETYNDIFAAQFAGDDPFGFNAAVARTTQEALASPALLQLGTVEQRAMLVLDQITATEVVTAEQLSDDGPTA